MSLEEITFGIPDELCYRAGIAATWKSQNTVSVFANTHPTYRTKDQLSLYGPADAKVHHIRREVILFDPILRKLVNESLGTFLRVHHTLLSKDQRTKTDRANLSRQYRSIIRACLENLDEEVRDSKNESDKEKYASYLTIFYSVECLWHLCEILYIEPIVGEAIVKPLLGWVRFHLPEHEIEATKILSSVGSVGAEEDLSYWDTVIGVFLQGRVDMVRALLKLHTASDSEIFREADEVLEAMPLYNVYGGVSINDFQLQWKHWQMDTLIKIDSKYFVTENNLEIIMKLAIGDHETWESEGMLRCETWYAYLAGRLFYTEPYLKRGNLGQYATKFWNKWPQTNVKHLDKTILAVMQQETNQVLHEIQQMSENGWFAAHLTDLLFHCGELKNTVHKGGKVESFVSIRNALIQEYGSLLMEHSSLWQVGAEYLSLCGKGGYRLLALTLERLPLKSEARSAKIIRIARKLKLPQVVNSIITQRARIAIRRNRHGHALGWALKSKDSILASQLADHLLRTYCKEGSLLPTDLDLLDSLGPSILLSERLMFLGKYFEFHKHYQAGQFKVAAMVLVALLSSKMTPNYFWDVLFTDVFPLLECDDIVLTSNDTYELLHCIEQNCNNKQLQDKLELLRFAVARNIARSLIHEIQSK